MQDLLKEEKLEQHISRLEKRISELTDDCKKNKRLRIKLTFFILSGLVYVIAMPFCDSILWLFVWLIVAPIIAVVIMTIAYVVLAYIINGVIKDMFAIGEMVGRKDAIELSKLNKE